jgi:hypothetical protein
MRNLWRKSIMMGEDIVVMLRAAGWRGRLWWYTLAIPCVAFCTIVGLAILLISPRLGLAVTFSLLAASFVYLSVRFASPVTAFPRWVARWIVVWPYAWGILKGLVTPIPNEARR